MGTTAQKLEYLGTTKSQLKDMINYGLDDNNKITSSTTFRNYVSSIFNAFLEALRNPDTLFTNLPKKSGSGSNITLNDTANAPMRIELSPSELTQAGTPTPSSPQDIHTISGSNTIKVEGNLFDMNWLSATGISISDGIVNGTATSIYNAFEKNGSYIPNTTNYKNQLTISMSAYTDANSTTSGNGLYMQVNYTDNTNSRIQFTNSDTTKTTKTLTTDGTKTIKNITMSYTTNGSNIWHISEIMINYGTTALPYTPYTSQEADIDLGDLEYCKIGNYENKPIRTSGIQLFDKDNTTIIDAFIDNSGKWTSSNTGEKSFIMQVAPNTTYTFSKLTTTRLRIVENSSQSFTFGNTYTKILNLISSNTGGTFTTGSNGNYIAVFFLNDSGETYTLQQVVNSIMINKGSTALPYEPYGSNEWYIKKNIGKVVLDGSEDWNIFNSSSSRVAFRIDISDIESYTDNSKKPDLFTTRFTSVSYNGTWVIGNVSRTSASTNRVIFVYEPNTTLEDWKTWLGSNNTIVYYVLATPTYTQITGTLAEQLENVYQKLLSYTGQTNISQENNDLSFELSVSAIEEL